MPEVPMLSATPAKRPRREMWTDAITSVGETIAHAIMMGTSAQKEDTVSCEQV